MFESASVRRDAFAARMPQQDGWKSIQAKDSIMQRRQVLSRGGMSLTRLCLIVTAIAATLVKPVSAWWTNSNSVSDETNTAQKQYGSARQEPNSPFDLDMDSDLYKD